MRLFALPQAPVWLPYRIRAWVDDRRVASALGDLEATAPMPVPPAERADAEIHMLVCRRDAGLGLLALKSLLRFAEDRLAIALTDDGTMDAASRTCYEQHLPGCRWLGPRLERVRQMLDGWPRLRELYEGPYAPARKLIHPVLCGSSRRVIVLDPDTTTFRSPAKVLEWATTGGPALFLHDHQDERVNVPSETRRAFESLESTVKGMGRPWSMPYYFFNSGLLCFEREQVDIPVLERYLEWRRGADPSWFRGKAALWFGEWTPEQTAYQVAFAVMNPAAEPLGEDYWLGADGEKVFNHYMRYYLVMPSTLSRLSTTAGSLRR